MPRYEQIGMEDARSKSGSGQLDIESAAALVTRTIADIDSRDDRRRFALLDDLLCAAWPTWWTQSQ